MSHAAPPGPNITVAVPTYNGSRHLGEALASILRSPTACELLVVDDRSDDDTLAIARARLGDRARIEVNSERLGLAGNWNRCVALGRTPVVALFHQDDRMGPGHLAAHRAAYEQDPDLGWVATAADVIDAAGASVPGSVVERGGLGDRDRNFAPGFGVPPLAVGNPLRCSAVTISRAAHAEVGGFDPSFRYVVDWDFWLRVARARPVAWRAETTVAIRWHAASETHRFATGTVDLDETARLLDWIGGLADPPSRPGPGWRRAADRRLARAFLNRAYAASGGGDPGLVRRALLRSIRLAPGAMVRRLLGDPRLLARMAAAWLAPGRPAGSNRSGVCREPLLPDRLESGDNG